jgi:shikimate dehydrogenase
MSISGRAKIAGVVGWPVSHSLSPRLHGFWLRETGIDGAYVPLAVARESLATALDGLRAAGFVGVNVTNPHKEAAFALADRVDDTARMAGAANLLVFRDGITEARNTDIAGFAESLSEGLGADAVRQAGRQRNPGGRPECQPRRVFDRAIASGRDRAAQSRDVVRLAARG